MYPQFFGLEKLPFRLRPDPDCRYAGYEYRQARTSLLDALGSDARMVSLKGGPGVGKTLLLEDILGELPDRTLSCRINQPLIAASEVLQALLLQFGDPPDAGADESQLLSAVAEALATDTPDARSALLIIDDAQLVHRHTIEMIGKLLARVPKLRVLLVGQPAKQHTSADFTKRLAGNYSHETARLLPMSTESCVAYIQHRLEFAGGGGKEIFSTDAYSTIAKQTGGAARLVNVICDIALHAACTRAAGQVGAADILHAAQDPRWTEALARHQEPPTAAPDELDADAPATAGRTTAQFVVRHRAAFVTTLPIESGNLSIGRASENDFQIAMPIISRHHCRVVTVGDVSTIEDLGSVNGISINGRVVKRHVLCHSDEVTVGEYVLTYLRP
jgi:general secretion pathway protein A